MSFFLEVLDRVRTADPAGKIGKDDVRFLSKETFERRIDELKQDSEGQDQDTLLKGIRASHRSVISPTSRPKWTQLLSVVKRVIDFDDLPAVSLLAQKYQ
jgi:hypothetical protein